MNTPYARYLFALWKHRKTLLKAAAAGLLVGLLVSLCIPREYEARTLTSVESIVIPDEEDWGNLAVGGALDAPVRYDALKPSLYPKIFTSTAFLMTLADLPVQTADCPPDSALSLAEYLERHLRRPWWACFPADIDLAAVLRERIDILPDQKTRTIAIACRMQDPLVAAAVLDSLNRRICRHITDYRTRKERADLSHAKKLQAEARAAYYRAQEAQAAFEDRNRDLSLNNARKELTRLRVQTDFAREEYARATLQVSAAETRVVRVRPVFAVIEPPTVPVRPVSPSKLGYMAGFALLGLAAGILTRLSVFRFRDTRVSGRD